MSELADIGLRQEVIEATHDLPVTIVSLDDTDHGRRSNDSEIAMFAFQPEPDGREFAERFVQHEGNAAHAEVSHLTAMWSRLQSSGELGVRDRDICAWQDPDRAAALAAKKATSLLVKRLSLLFNNSIVGRRRIIS